jgi:intein/homing endonuclease
LVRCLSSDLPIEDIKVGDKVFTARGVYDTVTNKFERDYDGMIYTIKPVAGLPFSVTEEHPILVVRNNDRFQKLAREYSQNRWGRPNWYKAKNIIRYIIRNSFREEDFRWVQASSLTKDDYLVFPIDKTVKDVEEIDVTPLYKVQMAKRETALNLRCKTGWGAKRVAKKLGLPLGTVYDHDFIVGFYDKRRKQLMPDGANKINEKVSVDGDLLRLFGYFVAEGTTPNEKYVGFCFNMNETELIDDVKRLMKKKFELNNY